MSRRQREIQCPVCGDWSDLWYSCRGTCGKTYYYHGPWYVPIFRLDKDVRTYRCAKPTLPDGRPNIVRELMPDRDSRLEYSKGWKCDECREELRQLRNAEHRLALERLIEAREKYDRVLNRLLDVDRDEVSRVVERVCATKGNRYFYNLMFPSSSPPIPLSSRRVSEFEGEASRQRRISSFERALKRLLKARAKYDSAVVGLLIVADRSWVERNIDEVHADEGKRHWLNVLFPCSGCGGCKHFHKCRHCAAEKILTE